MLAAVPRTSLPARRQGVGAMADGVVPAIVPRPASSSTAAAPAGLRSLPLPKLASLPRDAGMLYRIAAVDDRGRIAEDTVRTALSWHPGQPLHIAVLSSTTVALRSDPAGVFTLTRRGHLPLPTAARHWCALTSGDRVLLAAAPEHQLVLIHTMAALDAMVTAFHGDPAQ